MRHGTTRAISPHADLPGWIVYVSGERPIPGWPEGRDVLVKDIIDEHTICVRSPSGEEAVVPLKNVDLGEEVYLGGRWYPEYSEPALLHFAQLFREKTRYPLPDL